MARRVPKPLAPVLVGVVALVLGLITVGTSFADSGGVSGSDGGTAPNPHVTTAPASATPAPSTPGTPVPGTSAPADAAPVDTPPAAIPAASGKPKAPKPGKSGDSSSCSNCLGPPD